MLGMAKALMGGAVANSLYSVNLDPGVIYVEADNGSEISSTVYSTVISGVGPFTYQWTITGGNITIQTPTLQVTKFRSEGFDVTFNEVATLTVTDTGNANAETTRDIDVGFIFQTNS